MIMIAGLLLLLLLFSGAGEVVSAVDDDELTAENAMVWSRRRYRSVKRLAVVREVRRRRDRV